MFYFTMIWLTVVVWLGVQDSVPAPADSTTHTPTGPTSWIGFAIGYVISNIMPLLTAWITKKYLNLRDTWYTGLSDLMKRLVYIAGTSVLMVIVQALGLIWEPGMDVLTAENIISKIVLAAVSTVLVAVGIKTEQERSGGPHA
jgi:hypothetical protein